MNKLIHSESENSHDELNHEAQNALRSTQLLIRRLLRVIAVLGAFIEIAAVYDFVTTGEINRFLIITSTYLGLLIITFTPGVTYQLQTGVLLSVLYMIGVFSLITSGYAGNGMLFLLAVSVLSPLFMGRPTGIIITAVVILTFLVFALLFNIGVINVSTIALPYFSDTGNWILSVIVFVLITTILAISQNDFTNRFISVLTREKQVARHLGSEKDNLNEIFARNMQVAAQRERYLSASKVLAREAVSVIDDRGELIQRVVNIISEKFSFYHIGIFLNDSEGEWTELKATSSEGGKKMLDKAHRLRIGAECTVGYVALHGRPRIALDVGDDDIFLNNIDLPETRSEIALPLMLRDEIIGVLDVQSTESQAFDKDDIALMQSLADQVALAISNSRLYSLAQKSIQKERKLRENLSRESWRDLLMMERNLTAKSRVAGFVSEHDPWTPEMITALYDSEPTLDDQTKTRMALPVRVAGQTIGVVAARKSLNDNPWSEEEMRLLSTLSDQLSSALERARLYRQAQLTASRQRTITEVGAHMRASLQLESMLQTAASEIRNALDLGELEIRLAPPLVASKNAQGLSTEDEDYV